MEGIGDERDVEKSSIRSLAVKVLHVSGALFSLEISRLSSFLLSLGSKGYDLPAGRQGNTPKESYLPDTLKGKTYLKRLRKNP